jgi:uncharacterized DUF497 family protein
MGRSQGGEQCRKAKVAFAEAPGAFRDVQALQLVDRSMNSEEERFITIGIRRRIYGARGYDPLDFSAAGSKGL